MSLARAMYHWLAAGYFRWALNAMHPAHPDAGEVQLLHALHRHELQRWMEGKA
jgi:hypothetical protein